MDIEQPKFDELAPSLSDVDEAGDAIVFDNQLKRVATEAAFTATYFLALREAGVPAKRATDFTHHWLDLCAESED